MEELKKKVFGIGILCLMVGLVSAYDFQPVLVSNNVSFRNATIIFIDLNGDVTVEESFTGVGTQTSAVYYVTNFTKPYYYNDLYNVSVKLDGVWKDSDNRTPTFLGRSNLVNGNWNVTENVSAKYVFGNGSQLTDLPNPDLSGYALLDSSNQPFTDSTNTVYINDGTYALKVDGDVYLEDTNDGYSTIYLSTDGYIDTSPYSWDMHFIDLTSNGKGQFGEYYLGGTIGDNSNSRAGSFYGGVAIDTSSSYTQDYGLVIYGSSNYPSIYAVDEYWTYSAVLTDVQGYATGYSGAVVGTDGYNTGVLANGYNGVYGYSPVSYGMDSAGYFENDYGATVKLCSNSYAIETYGDAYFDGKVTSTGGYDPPYVLYDQETRESVTDRVAYEIPPKKLGGAILFFNNETQNLEVKIGEKYFKITMEEIKQ